MLAVRMRHFLRILWPAFAIALLLTFFQGGIAQAQVKATATGTSVPTSVPPPTPNYVMPPPGDPEDPPAEYDAATGFSISAPTTMAPGSTAYVTVTIRNSGTSTWYPGVAYPYRLGSQNPQDNQTWGLGRVDLGSTVAPGGQAVFGFTITAPSTPGSYTFGWAMLRESMYWFGGNISSTITVSPPATPRPTISPSHTAMTAGSNFTMSWSTTDATSLSHVCAAAGTGYTVNESLATSGSRVVTAQAGWVNYPSSCTWTASGAGGSTTYTETMTTVTGSNSSVTYIHTDGLGSPVARTDATGAVISRTRYEPYGYVASGVQPTIGFTGHVNDVDTGLTYMQQRYYDPVAGRFLSIDPVTTDANTGGSFNRYAYANNSPYKYTDPDGRFAFLIPFIPYVATATVAIVGHYVLPGRQGREDTARAVGNAILNHGDTNQTGTGGGKSTPLPDKLVGVQDGKSGTQGNRENRGPLAPEHGGTNDAGKDFDKLSGGKSGPAPEGSKYPPGTQVGENGVALRPEGKTGPRIDIPANGDKPHETLHYPKKDP